MGDLEKLGAGQTKGQTGDTETSWETGVRGTGTVRRMRHLRMAVGEMEKYAEEVECGSIT